MRCCLLGLELLSYWCLRLPEPLDAAGGAMLGVVVGCGDVNVLFWCMSCVVVRKRESVVEAHNKR
jgi:hypothetical protein